MEGRETQNFLKSQSLYRGRAQNFQSLGGSSGVGIFQVPEPRVKLGIFPSPKAHIDMGVPNPIYRHISSLYRHISFIFLQFSTNFFIFSTLFFHIFDIFHLIFDIFLHIFHKFLHIYYIKEFPNVTSLRPNDGGREGVLTRFSDSGLGFEKKEEGGGTP